MKVIDYFMRALVAVTFVTLLACEKTAALLVGFSFFAIGIWGILYPQGILGWAKTAHPGIDINDESIWWVPRLIGTFFIAFVVLFAAAFLFR
jgi:hypothetical protein